MKIIPIDERSCQHFRDFFPNENNYVYSMLICASSNYETKVAAESLIIIYASLPKESLRADKTSRNL